MKLTKEELGAIAEKGDDADVVALLKHIKQLQAELDGKYELLTLSDIARMDGVSRQSIYSMSVRKKFPEPVTTVGNQRLWARHDIDQWFKERFS